MKFGLPEKTMAQIIDVFEAYAAVDKAFLFGSRAKGNYRPDSDIDIAVKGFDISPDDIIKISVALDEKDIGYKVDLLDYDGIMEKAVKEHIDRVGVEVYSRWREYVLKELGTLERGKSKHRPRYAFHLYGGEYPFVQTGDIKEASKYITTYKQTYSEAGLRQSRLWPKGTLCITIAANIADVAILKIDACFPDSVLGFIAKENKCDVDFVYYTLVHFQRELQLMGDGSVQSNINLGTFDQIKFPFPPLVEQKVIAEILSSLDDKIDLLHRQNNTLEQLAETLFRQWFVEEAETKFELGTLGQYVDYTVGGEWGKENPEGEYNIAVQCLRGTDIADLQNGLANKVPVRYVKEKKLENIHIRSGDIIMEISGGSDDQSTGRSVYINDDIKHLFSLPLIFSNFCRLIRPKDSKFSLFLYSYIKHLYDQGDLFNLENGSSGIRNLDYKSLLFDLKYRLPPKTELMKYFDNVKDYFLKINMHKKQIRTLIQLRDSLMPKLMSGEVRVKL